MLIIYGVLEDFIRRYSPETASWTKSKVKVAITLYIAWQDPIYNIYNFWGISPTLHIKLTAYDCFSVLWNRFTRTLSCAYNTGHDVFIFLAS